MKREDALGEIGDRYLEESGVDGLINAIYDSFEKIEKELLKQIEKIKSNNSKDKQ